MVLTGVTSLEASINRRNKTLESHLAYWVLGQEAQNRRGSLNGLLEAYSMTGLRDCDEC